MKFRSVFDIIGPIMVGPSSSHTAGAAKIGKMARKLFGREPKEIYVQFYGSFAETYRGHGTDVAIVAGVLDFDTFDTRLPESIDIATSKNIKITFCKEDAVPVHPNTAKLTLIDGEESMEIVGISIGGGKIEITELNGFELRVSGNHPVIFVVHHDRKGVIASVSNVLASLDINIGHMEVSRKEKGSVALMVIEVDQFIDPSVLETLQKLENVVRVTKVED